MADFRAVLLISLKLARVDGCWRWLTCSVAGQGAEDADADNDDDAADVSSWVADRVTTPSPVKAPG